MVTTEGRCPLGATAHSGRPYLVGLQKMSIHQRRRRTCLHRSQLEQREPQAETPTSSNETASASGGGDATIRTMRFEVPCWLNRRTWTRRSGLHSRFRGRAALGPRRTVSKHNRIQASTHAQHDLTYFRTCEQPYQQLFTSRTCIASFTHAPVHTHTNQDNFCQKLPGGK